MGQDHDEMKHTLVTTVIPALRERGFTGTFPHFRRVTQAKTDLITFQFDRHGGGFVVEIAEGPAGELTTLWGQKIPASRLTAHDLHPNERARLQPGMDGTVDSWYRYDRGFSTSDVAMQLASDLSQADAWWAGAKDQPSIRRFGQGAV
jgi:uncharacterized protein DUF4304